RDDRYNDEYDLSQKNKHPAYSKAPVRQEQLPNWTGMQEDVPLSPEELAELERQKQELLGE
ncbi:helix-turn-helix domain-containing protein, partial [Enterococcus faecalis]|nr:helix-turn-helix domain-containing protein [Enterococcus faecalis]